MRSARAHGSLVFAHYPPTEILLTLFCSLLLLFLLCLLLRGCKNQRNHHHHLLLLDVVLLLGDCKNQKNHHYHFLFLSLPVFLILCFNISLTGFTGEPMISADALTIQKYFLQARGGAERTMGDFKKEKREKKGSCLHRASRSGCPRSLAHKPCLLSGWL